MDYLLSKPKSKNFFKYVFIFFIIFACSMTLTLSNGSLYAQDSAGSVEKAELSENDNSTETTDVKVESAWYDSIIIKIIGVSIILIVLYVVYMCLPVFAVFQSKMQPGSVIEHIGESKGSKGKKVLLGYVTRHGTSSSIAQRIYDVLVEKGHDVDMRFIPNIGKDEVANYDFFILGSSVYWVMAKEFVNFVTTHREILSKKPVAVFATCMTIQRDTPKNRERVQAYFDSGLKKVPEIKPIDKEPFAGKVDMSKLNSMEIAFLKLLFLVTPLQGGDHRDWNKISAWAEKISEEI